MPSPRPSIFPARATVLQIEQVYLSAWHLGPKGHHSVQRRLQTISSAQYRQDRSNKKPFNAGPEESATDSPAPALLLDQIASIAMLYDSRDIRLDERCPGCDTPSDLHVKYESCYLCPSCGYNKC